jgi:hypothetical protein
LSWEFKQPEYIETLFQEHLKHLTPQLTGMSSFRFLGLNMRFLAYMGEENYQPETVLFKVWERITLFKMVPAIVT